MMYAKSIKVDTKDTNSPLKQSDDNANVGIEKQLEVHQPAFSIPLVATRRTDTHQLVKPISTSKLVIDARVPTSAKKVVQFNKDPPAMYQPGGGTPQRTRSAAVDTKDVKCDPPTFFPSTKAANAKDPPSLEDRAETQTKEVVHSMDTKSHSTFGEALKSRWNLLRRGLEALGLIDVNATHTSSGDTADEIFFDALELAPVQQHLVEDVSDEDDEICNLRRASLNVPRNEGDSWMEPVDSPRRRLKPDP